MVTITAPASTVRPSRNNTPVTRRSAPIVSADGREALLQTSVVGGVLAGAGWVQHLRLRRGAWVRTDAINIWIA